MRWPKLCKAIEYLVDRHGPIDGHTRLLELVYLADQRWLSAHNASAGRTSGSHRSHRAGRARSCQAQADSGTSPRLFPQLR